MAPRLRAKPNTHAKMQRSSTQFNGPGQTPKPDVQQPTWTRGSSLTKNQDHGTHDGETSFRLRIPYLKALDTPPEIPQELRKFALKFPNDLLTDGDLLHAHLVWYDLLQAPELNQERSMEEARKGAKRDSAAWTVPEADLVECILAWPHYLRWTEETGGSECHNLFRVSEKGSPVVVNDAILPENIQPVVDKDEQLAKPFAWSDAGSTATSIRPRTTLDEVHRLTLENYPMTTCRISKNLCSTFTIPLVHGKVLRGLQVANDDVWDFEESLAPFSSPTSEKNNLPDTIPLLSAEQDNQSFDQIFCLVGWWFNHKQH
ncbi:hypothetical protein CI102_8634 [Trichoderma harzianum]|nr:hypothetical protein CI102_8634 [Trichoderma harzianum]